MTFLQYLIKHGDVHPDQIESLSYYLDLELRDSLIKSGTITPARVAYRWGQYYDDILSKQDRKAKQTG